MVLFNLCLLQTIHCKLQDLPKTWDYVSWPRLGTMFHGQDLVQCFMAKTWYNVSWPRLGTILPQAGTATKSTAVSQWIGKLKQALVEMLDNTCRGKGSVFTSTSDHRYPLTSIRNPPVSLLQLFLDYPSSATSTIALRPPLVFLFSFVTERHFWQSVVWTPQKLLCVSESVCVCVCVCVSWPRPLEACLICP